MKLVDELYPPPEGRPVAIIVGIVLFVCLVNCFGCATTKPCAPCTPEIETITVYVPSLRCPEPEILPTLTYPDWPEVPYGASEVALKAFYADVVATQKAREKILLDRIAAQATLLDTFRND